MILHHNVVVRGQTYLSGEWVNFDFNKLDPREYAVQSRMKWLHEHQTALRVALELRTETPHYGTNRHIFGDQGNNGDINTGVSLGQNTPAAQ